MESARTSTGFSCGTFWKKLTAIMIVTGGDVRSEVEESREPFGISTATGTLLNADLSERGMRIR